MREFISRSLPVSPGNFGDRLFRRLLEKAPVALYTCDASGLITFFNARAERLWGRAPRLNDPVDRFCGSFKLFSPDGSPIVHEECWMALALKENREYNGCEIVVERPDGGRVTVFAHANPIHDESRELIGAVNALIDATALGHMGALRQQTAAIVESADDAIIAKALDGTILSWNQGAERIYGYRANEVIGKPISILLPTDRADELPAIMASLQRGERVEHFETKRRRKDGREIDVSVTISPIRSESGIIVGASAVARDITDEKMAQRSVRQKDQRRALAKGREAECKRIARELHDNFAQRLAFLMMNVDKLTSLSSTPKEIADHIDSFRMKLDELSDDIRALSHRLHPSLLDLLGLQAALKHECGSVSLTTGLSVAFSCGEFAEDVRSELGLAIYRVAQEALRNIAKHAGANHAKVSLWSSGDELFLQIEDDGRGFDPESRHQTGRSTLGLLSMAERMELVDGHLSVDSRPGKGTILRAVAPLRANPDNL